ncbi:UNVERIFIED_CONTAM: hypothetical protein FKN15_014724 [Acipenser sinensis]
MLHFIIDQIKKVISCSDQGNGKAQSELSSSTAWARFPDRKTALPLAFSSFFVCSSSTRHQVTPESLRHCYCCGGAAGSLLGSYCHTQEN